MLLGQYEDRDNNIYSRDYIWSQPYLKNRESWVLVGVKQITNLPLKVFNKFLNDYHHYQNGSIIQKPNW